MSTESMVGTLLGEYITSVGIRSSTRDFAPLLTQFLTFLNTRDEDWIADNVEHVIVELKCRVPKWKYHDRDVGFRTLTLLAIQESRKKSTFCGKKCSRAVDRILDRV
jgi:hypothetical protein